MAHNHKIGWQTATAIVIANMIGAGVFTSLGFQLQAVTNTWSIVLLWSLGAIMALTGALSYAELSTSMTRSGGEYQFLSKMYHPILGYLSGWVSLTVGFAAPVALASMAFGEYTSIYLGIDETILAIIALVTITLLHTFSIKQSSIIQNITTVFKLAILLIIIMGGFYFSCEINAFEWGNSWQSEMLIPGFAVSFVYVTFSYSGWNAASYIAEEIDQPRKNIPRALILGTLIVSLIYIVLNLIFLKHSSLSGIQGELEIGQIVATNIFGDTGGKMISLAIGLILISSISAMVWIGPRVTQVMGEDHKFWAWFAKKSQEDIPRRAIFLQMVITLILLLSSTFQQILIYSGFILQLFASLTVASVFINRRKNKNNIHYKSPLYPLPQIVFLSLSAWVLLYLVYNQPVETAYGMINILLGVMLYVWGRIKLNTK